MTILPKKKPAKEKACEPSSHEHHGNSQHTVSEGHAARTRHPSTALRSASHSGHVLEERHRPPRIGHVPLQHSVEINEAVVVQHRPEFGAALSPVSIADEASHAVPQQPSAEIADLAKVTSDAKVSTDRTTHGVVKRRHGRTSPHAATQPYARGKASRTDGAGECSSSSVSHHHTPRRHYKEDRTLSSTDIPTNALPAPRAGRRRVRPRPEGKEETGGSGHNSDDEYDAARLRRLHEDVDFEELEQNFAKALKSVRGFYVKEMVEDGACLFRAVADQVYGDQNLHDEVRSKCMDYMMKNADFFSNFITEDFRTYITRKKMPHTHGNHLEMQAMAEMYNRSFEVYQYSTEPINTFQSSNVTDNDPLRVSYHRNSHYNSVVNPYKASIGVGLGLPSLRPGLADQMLLETAQRSSEQELLEQQMLEDKLRAADWETTEEEMVREVAQKSFSDYLRHREEVARQSNASKTEPETGPSCSQSSSSSQNPPQPPTSSSLNKTDSATSSNSTSTSGPSTSAAPVVFCNPGMGDWVDETEENAVLAQVMAQSQREYYVTLTRPDSAAASCSKYPTDQ